MYFLWPYISLEEVGTAMSYGFNINIKEVSNINNPENSDVNVMNSFKTQTNVSTTVMVGESTIVQK